MQHASKCIEQRMRRLAEKPHTQVLEYSYETQERGADAVTCVKLFQRVAEIRGRLDASMAPTDAHRAVLEEDPSLEEFARNFPAIFRNALDVKNVSHHLNVLQSLARLRKEVESGSMTEAEANVHATRIILEKTMRGPTEQERAKHSL